MDLHTCIKIQCPHADSESICYSIHQNKVMFHIVILKYNVQVDVTSQSATASIWTIKVVSSHTSKSICCCVQLNYTWLTMCKQCIHLLQHPSSQKDGVQLLQQVHLLSIQLERTSYSAMSTSPSASVSNFIKVPSVHVQSTSLSVGASIWMSVS